MLAVTPDEHAWQVDPANLSEAASTTHRVSVTFAGSCSQLERLATPALLRVSGRRPGGSVVSRTVGFDASFVIESPRRSCGLADFASSLESQVVGAHRRGPVAIVDLQLRNRSRHAGRLTALRIPATQVTTRPRLPVALPPSVAEHPALLVRLQLTVRYVVCLPAGQGSTDLTLDLVDKDGASYTIDLGLDDPTIRQLNQLASDACRQ